MCDHLIQVLSCKSLMGCMRCQPVMSYTVWAGKPQKLVNDNGVLRGHEKVLGKKQRRGLTICELYCNIIMTSLQKKNRGRLPCKKRSHCSFHSEVPL